MTSGIPHPFEILWDVEAASYSIFVPDGCILVNGVAATNDDVENGNLALDFGDTPPEKVYCHVKREDGEWRFSVDGDEHADGSRFDVPVATFSNDENDGLSYDILCSSLVLSDVLASFSAYRGNDGKWTLFEPLVAAPSGIVAATLPSEFGVGTYYAHVRELGDGSCEAFVDASESASAAEGETVVTTKVCEFAADAGGDVVLAAQYHVGTIVVDGAGKKCAVDDKSIEEHNAGTESAPKPQHAIKGWHDQDAAEGTSIGGLLKGGSSETREVLVRKGGKGGATEFVSVGTLKAGGVDDISICEHTPDGATDPVHAIKGWHDAEKSASKLADLLTGENEDNARQVLVRNGKGGATEYLPLGKIVVPDPLTPDDFDAEASAETLSPSADATADVTLANGTFSFDFGIPKGEKGDPGDDGNDGKSPSVALADVTGDTSHPNGGVKVSVTNADGTKGDEKTVWNGEDGKDGGPGKDGLSITSVSVEAGSPVEGSEGYTKTPITFTFTMSDGSTITSNSVDILAKNGSSYEPEVDEVSFVGDVKYDVSSHQLQQRIDTFNPKTGTVEIDPTGHKMITGGQAVPHSGEDV